MWKLCDNYQPTNKADSIEYGFSKLDGSTNTSEDNELKFLRFHLGTFEATICQHTVNFSQAYWETKDQVEAVWKFVISSESLRTSQNTSCVWEMQSVKIFISQYSPTCQIIQVRLLQLSFYYTFCSWLTTTQGCCFLILFCMNLFLY